MFENLCYDNKTATLGFSFLIVYGLIGDSHTCRLGYARGSQPPPEIFFSQLPPTWKLLDTPGPKNHTLGHFSGLSGVSGNTWQLPGVSRCIQVYPKKNFSGRRPKKFFFDRVSRPPPENFFSQKKIFFFTLISIHVRVRKIVSLQFKTSTFSL